MAPRPAKSRQARRPTAAPAPTGKTSGRRRIKPLSPTESGTSFEDKYPNLAARQELDRALHVKAARAMGATRKQASRHANEEVGAH